MISIKNVAAVAVLAIAAVTIAQEARLELQADLKGTGKGKVTWKVRDKGNEHQAELEAEGERLAKNTTYALKIGSNPPFSVTTNALGTYHLELRFGTTNRPTIAVGTAASVVDAKSAVVQSGVFQPK